MSLFEFLDTHCVKGILAYVDNVDLVKCSSALTCLKNVIDTDEHLNYRRECGVREIAFANHMPEYIDLHYNNYYTDVLHNNYDNDLHYNNDNEEYEYEYMMANNLGIIDDINYEVHDEEYEYEYMMANNLGIIDD